MLYLILIICLALTFAGMVQCVRFADQTGKNSHPWLHVILVAILYVITIVPGIYMWNLYYGGVTHASFDWVVAWVFRILAALVLLDIIGNNKRVSRIKTKLFIFNNLIIASIKSD